MTTIDILTDLHIGRHKFSREHLDDARDFIDWVIEMSTGRDILIVNGDTFDNKRVINPETLSFAEDAINKMSMHWEEVYFNVGNHDGIGKRVFDETIFSMLRMQANVFVCTTPNVIHKNEFSFQILPYGFDDDLDNDVDFVFSHTDFLEAKKTIVLNGHIHESSFDEEIPENAKFINLGIGYQLDPSDSDKFCGIHHISGNREISKTLYTRKTYANIRLENNKIENEQPVKWIMANKDMIKNLRGINVIVDHLTAKANLNRFTGILSTINSNFNLIDSIAEAEETTVMTSTSVIETLKQLLPDEEGYAEKITEIYQQALDSK